MKYDKHFSLQEREMWIGLELSAFGSDLDIDDVPNSIYVPHFFNMWFSPAPSITFETRSGVFFLLYTQF